MKTLTIEHLAAYLPYGLEFQSGHFLIGLCDGSSDVVRPMLMSESKHGCIDWEANFNMDKPILRPLSDLTREITHNGETFVPIDKLGWVKKWGDAGMGQIVYCEYGETPRTTVNAIDYIKDLQMIWSWHFDTFGLIEAGLAIPIPSIPQP